MTTTWLLICPTPLALMLPVMPLSQPMPNSALHLGSGSVVCARAIPATPRQTVMMAATAARFTLVGVMGFLTRDDCTVRATAGRCGCFPAETGAKHAKTPPGESVVPDRRSQHVVTAGGVREPSSRLGNLHPAANCIAVFTPATSRCCAC
jgi:hypothetical protein